MSDKLSILFIINPISGVSKKKNIPSLIDTILDKEKFSYSITFTEYPKHGKEIADQQQYKQDIIVAVGGDGTINEIGSSLIHSECALAILPSGSGNGLARDLNIPLDINKAIQRLNTASFSKIDTCYLNERPFFCTAGIGFDADVAHKFAQSNTRGLKTYITSVLKVLSERKYINLTLTIGAQKIQQQAFSITFANAKQFGNNFQIAPKADLKDGIIDICLIHKMSSFSLFPLLFRLLNGKIDQLNAYHHYPSKDIVQLKLDKPENIHIDGEATTMRPTEISIKNEQQSLTLFH